MPDAPPSPRVRIRRIRRAVATGAAIVFLGAWAAVGALGKGTESTSSSATAASVSGSDATASQDGADTQSGSLPPVTTSQS